MEKRQKSTLRSHHIMLANDLVLDEDFYASTRKYKIFTDGMISIIKTVTKPRDQVFKMLELLEKRGPKAFDNFVWILKEHYDWLAEELEETYQQKLQGETAFARGREEEHTQPKSMSNEKEDMTRFPSLCRATSIPATAQRTSKKMPQQPQAPVSASVSMTGRNENNIGQFFPSHFQNSIQLGLNDNNDEDEFDETDTNWQQECKAIGEVKRDTGKNVKTTAPQFTDACISPIQTLESPRKKAHATCSPIPQQHCSSATYNQFKLPYISQENATDELDYGGNKDQVSQDDYDNASDTNSNRDGNEFDDVDGFDNDGDLNNYVDPNEDDIESSEAFYDTIRRKSQIADEENERIATQNGAEIAVELNEQNSEEDNVEEENILGETINTTDSSLYEYQNEESDKIREIYLRLLTLTTEMKEEPELDLDKVEEIDKNGITFDMILEEIDRLTEIPENSAEHKLKTCYDLFDEKDKRTPLNKLIEKLKEEKLEYSSKFFEEVKKTNEMANDMYNHSQEMKNIEKMKSKLKTLEMENNDLKSKYITMEGVNGRQSKRIEELERNKKEYEDAKLLEEKRLMATKKGSTTRKASYGGTSPRRAPLYSEPRLSMLNSGSVYPSARSRNLASGPNWKQYNKK